MPRSLARDPARAHAALRLAIGLLLATLGVGLGWDRRWHTTHVFDSFYSPPHLFIYTATTLTAVVVTLLAFKRGLRESFGPTVRLWPLRVAAPGPVFIVGAGFVGLGLAGLLDDRWHTAFGLDETGWSAPHAMLAWGWLVTALGFLSCRLALRPVRPWRPWTGPCFALLILGFSARPLLGPLGDARTPARTAAIARLPVFAAQAPIQHTFRIETAWELARTNPWFAVLAALWAGAVLALLGALIRRPAALLGLLALWATWGAATGLATTLGTDRRFGLHEARDLAVWLPPALPLLAAALALALARRLGVGERRCRALAGIAAALIIFAIWGRTPAAAALGLLAPSAFMLGAALGDWIWGTLASPRPRRAWALVVGCACAPLLTGLIDLALRHATP